MFVLHTSLAKINKQFILLIKNINTYSVLLKVLQYKFECSKYLLQYDMFTVTFKKTVKFKKIIVIPYELYHE